MNRHTPTPTPTRLHRRAAGHTTKFWITPDGRFHDTGGSYLFRWAQANATYLQNHYGVEVAPFLHSTNEYALRLHLIQQGMVRVNHLGKTNSLLVEGTVDAFNDEVVEALTDFLHAHSGSIAFCRTHRFDRKAEHHDRHLTAFHWCEGPLDRAFHSSVKDLRAFLQGRSEPPGRGFEQPSEHQKGFCTSVSSAHRLRKRRKAHAGIAASAGCIAGRETGGNAREGLWCLGTFRREDSRSSGIAREVAAVKAVIDSERRYLMIRQINDRFS